MKKFFFLTLFSLFFSLHAVPYDNVREYTLENGLTIFVLEDTSTPLIRIEYSVRAGFSNQTKETCGFFKLYTRIFENASALDFDLAECNADSSRYVLTLLPSQLEKAFNTLAQNAFSPSFSDDVLKRELSELKKEVTEEAESTGAFINTAIDSRVFSAAPWKHDFGVYPSLFNKTTLEQARNILQKIGERYYTPQNSALFICGNVNADVILSLINDSFGYYYSSYSVPYRVNIAAVKNAPAYKTKKFVIHSSEISKDMTQLVMQYKGLNIEETELLAQLLNNDNSLFKNNLVNQTRLNIPGNEYINAASAHKKDSSRLIIQSILQKPQDKNLSSVTSLEQAKLFIETVLNGIKETDYLEFYAAQMMTVSNLSSSNSSSTDFMTNLASYWALEPEDSFIEEVLEESQKSLTAGNLFSKEEKIRGIDFATLLSKIQAEEPYIFVIINTEDFKKNQAKYKEAGFEEVNTSNAAWYNQTMFKNYEDPENEDSYAGLNSKSQSTSELLYTKDFYKENISLIETKTLSNGIKLVSKYNKNSSDITIMLSIKGGKLNSADDNGFEEVLVNLLASNIEKDLLDKQGKGIILGNPSVDYYCGMQTSTVTLECAPYDFAGCCKAISDAIIYGEILPAQADRAIAGRQYKKRLENGSVSFQMLAAVMEELYPKSDYTKIFEAKKDILTNTSYQKILESYPGLLDADRYDIIITGAFPENAQALLESSMGLLTSRGTRQKVTELQSKFKNGSTKKTVAVTHTFLTDIPAEKAGPQPAKLIPTEEFLDPVIYVFKLPAPGSQEHTLSLAVFKYLETLVQEEIAGNSKIKEAKAECGDYYPGSDIITFTIQNVSESKEADSCFARAVSRFNSLLNSEKQSSIIQEIKDVWTQSFMALSLTNTGSASLIQKGFENFPYNPEADYYLKEYSYVQKAEREAFVELVKNIPQQAPLRFYAKQ